MPVWQRLVVWLLFAVVIAAVWYYIFYLDAVTAREGAEQSLAKAKTELVRLEEKKANHLEELRKHEERKAALKAERTELSTSSATVENLMQTFQQKARQVGLSFDSWKNEGEQRQDVYARLPVLVTARGTWAQTGEFFRQLSELKQTVSIENIRLNVKANRSEAEQVENPVLDLEFEAATYRALTEQERSAPSNGRAKPSRRKGAKKRK
ncbi:MAG: type 4a pilus biogenesis protein PilO [Myxococcota bacterium]